MTIHRRENIFVIDFGTSESKFGPMSLGEKPRVVETRGYFPQQSASMQSVAGKSREVVVGREVLNYFESKQNVSQRLVYPMRHGHIDKDDRRSWRVMKELTAFALQPFIPSTSSFRGFNLVASLSANSPRYMFEELFEQFHEISQESGAIQAATIIRQPLAVAFSQSAMMGVVVESGEGNTQVCPISRYPIKESTVAINRGGADGNALTCEILKDCGFGDLAHDESVVRGFKENVGAIPAELHAATHIAQSDPERFRATYSIPGTGTTIDLAKNSSMRFLIGEYVFNPNDDVFTSYFGRGMPRPEDVRIGDTVLEGDLDFGDAIVRAVGLCQPELQSRLYSHIILSGGNFQWRVPPSMEDVAVDSQTKILRLLEKKDVPDARVTLVENPRFSVWRGCIIYGCSVPVDIPWTWDHFEGWKIFS